MRKPCNISLSEIILNQQLEKNIYLIYFSSNHFILNFQITSSFPMENVLNALKPHKPKDKALDIERFF